jgi:hypothetical protein
LLRQLFIVDYDRGDHTRAFEEVARRVEALDPGIRARVIRDRPYVRERWRMAARPSLYFSAPPLRRLRPLRGRVFQGERMRKSREFERLRRAGLPVPRWQRLYPKRPPDLEGWPAYVIVKPEYGRRGSFVWLMRRERVRWRALAESLGDPIVQEFVYTGPWPSSYRVSTLFGDVLYAWKVEANPRRRPYPEQDWRRGRSPGGESVVSNRRDSRIALNRETDVLRLGRLAARAFPRHPLLGVDIVRDHETGALWIVEVNAIGYTWHLSGWMSESIQRDNAFDLASQYGGLAWAAEILAAATRRFAR